MARLERRCSGLRDGSTRWKVEDGRQWKGGERVMGWVWMWSSSHRVGVEASADVGAGEDGGLDRRVQARATRWHRPRAHGRRLASSKPEGGGVRRRVRGKG